MDQRGPMPPGVRGFVTFVVIAVVMLVALALLQRVHPISHRASLVSFYSAGAFAFISAYLVTKKPT